MPADPNTLSFPARAGYYLSDLCLGGLIHAFNLLPYRWRVPALGWVSSRIVAPLAGFNKRVRNNLNLTCPDLSEPEIRDLTRGVSDNAGRSMMETFAGKPFYELSAACPISGPGFEAFKQARAENRPVLLITGHFGNYNAARRAFAARGYEMGVLYRRMANPDFNSRYVAAMGAIGQPMFEQGRRGMAEMVRYLRGGGVVAIVADLHAHGGRELTFFGQPAVTSVITAELALKYNAVLIPTYVPRQPDGLQFKVVMHDPIPLSDPETMMQAANDDLEGIVRQHMDQWFWIHRRWKPWMHLGLQPEDSD
jgi:KDO2-lipid IV(A) lauroyltransferase